MVDPTGREPLRRAKKTDVERQKIERNNRNDCEFMKVQKSTRPQKASGGNCVLGVRNAAINKA